MKISCIINPASGQDQPVLAVLNRAFAAAEADWDVHVTKSAQDARDAAHRAAKDADVVAVYGGDGTVSEVANALLGGDTPLALLPGGTGNVIAQELGVPLDLTAAAELVCSPNAQRVSIDAMMLRERAYFLRIGVGAEAAAIVGATRDRKDELGWFGYVLGTLDAMRDAQPIEFHWHMDDADFEGQAVACMVANIGRIGRGGLRFSESIKADDGLLDVLIIRDARLGTAGAVTASAFGAEPELGDPTVGLTEQPFQRFQCRQIRIETDRDVAAHGDGDAIDPAPLEISIRPQCLSVLLPPPDDA